MEIKYLADNKWAIPTLARGVYKNLKLFRDDDQLETMIAKYKKLANKEIVPFTLVAFEKRRQVLGTVSVVVDNMPVMLGSPPWLAALYVDTAHRKKGIGSALVKKAMEEMRKLSVKKICLFTTDGFRVALYKKLGWKVVKQINYKGVEKIVMAFEYG
jgi:predicted N-acetyltransferase YhbS